MKPIVKLLFAALIICVSLILPKSTLASSGMTCRSGMAQCQGAIQSSMYQCVAECRESGQSSLVWYCVYYIGCSGYDQTSQQYYGCSADVTCSSSPAVNASCIQNCISTYQPQFNACTAEYCTNN
jgi:hypothetical protein